MPLSIEEKELVNKGSRPGGASISEQRVLSLSKGEQSMVNSER